MSMRSGSMRIGLGVLLLSLFPFPGGSAHAIESRRQWDAAFRLQFPGKAPLLGDPGGHPGDLFAWHGHYWIRSYVSMARSFGDRVYLDRAATLIDHILAHREDTRAARGEVDPREHPYYSAPPRYLRHRDRAPPGWRRLWDGKDRVDLVTDGMIVQAILRFADLVLHCPSFSSYREKAQGYVREAEKTVRMWDETFAYGRAGVPGSYWFPQTDGTPGISLTEVPFNQSAVMAGALLLLDGIQGGVTEYRRKAEAVLVFWRNRRRETADGGYVWRYYLVNPEYGVEDLDHSQMDLSFLALADRFGLLTEEEGKRLAATLTRTIYKGRGRVASHVDGTGLGRGYLVGIDWIDLARHDPGVLAVAKETYAREERVPGWSRPFLGWAEILRWTETRKRRHGADGCP